VNEKIMRRRSVFGSSTVKPDAIYTGVEQPAVEQDASALEMIELDGAQMSRRSFFTRMSAAGLGLAAASLLGGTTLSGCGGGGGNSLSGGNDPFAGLPGSDINTRALNYALTLEILEADLYRQALNRAAGRALTAPLDATIPSSGSLGSYTRSGSIGNGGISSTLADIGFLYLVQFAYVELAHRRFLERALGGGAVKPNPKGYAFPGGPGSTISEILSNILVLEETGVRAYLGATPYITNLTLTQTAGTIYSTEARHSAAVSYLINNGNSGPVRKAGDKEVASASSEKVFEKFLEPQTVVSAIQPFLVK
jgi:rubrerythrin